MIKNQCVLVFDALIADACKMDNRVIGTSLLNCKVDSNTHKSNIININIWGEREAVLLRWHHGNLINTFYCKSSLVATPTDAMQR